MEMIKALRLTIDSLINTIELLDKSREVSLAFTDAQRAKSWLGKCLADYGTATPYPKSDDPNSLVIEKQADHTGDTIDISSYDNQIAKVKATRAFIENILDKKIDRLQEIWALSKASVMPLSIDMMTYHFSLSMQWLEESKMWLGYELNRILETKEEKV